MVRLYILVACIAGMLSGCAYMQNLSGTGHGLEDSGAIALTPGEMLADIDRYRAMSENAAKHEQQALSGGDRAEDFLRLAILELYGPGNVSSPDRGHERLETIRRQNDVFRYRGSRQLVELLETHWETILKLDERVARLSEQLEALRQIEDEIGNRD